MRLRAIYLGKRGGTSRSAGALPVRPSWAYWGAIERLEDRTLLTLTITALSATEGFPFQGMVGSFAANDVQGTLSDYKATIQWGDGHVTNGTIAPGGPGQFNISGVNTYAISGTYPISIVLTGTGGSMATAQGSANVAAVLPKATGTAITAVVNQPFSGRVLSFTDPYLNLSPANYTATIAWGDGQVSIGTVQPPDSLGIFNVTGTNTYFASGTFPVNVTITRNVDGQSATASSQAVVVNPTFAFTGGLNPLSQTGSSPFATQNNQPTLTGTAPPSAVIQLFSERSDQLAPVPLGQAIASPSGVWSLTVGPLAHGVYTLSAVATPPAGFPSPRTLLTPGSLLIIDLVAPRVLNATFSARTGLLQIVVHDNLSGLDPNHLLNVANYTLLGLHGRVLPSSAVTAATVRPLNPSDPNTMVVTLSINPKYRRRLLELLIGQGGITDQAGNPLASEFRKAFVGGSALPSGPLSPRAHVRMHLG